ncbi:MAG: GAF domain-containing protein [Chloroflexota bacterium]
MMTQEPSPINRAKPLQRWLAILLSLTTVLITLLVYCIESWNPVYAPVAWYLFLLPIGLTAYTYGLGIGLGLSALITALFAPIVAKHLREYGLSPLAINLLTTTLVINGFAALVGYFGGSQRQQRDLYRTLNLLGERFSQELQVDELLEVILRQAVAQLEADMGEILLQDEKSGQLRVAASTNGNQSTARGPNSGQDESLGQWLLQQNTPFLHNALLQDPRFTWVAGSDRELPGSLIAAPLRRGRQAFGLLCLLSLAPGAFGKRDLEMLVAIAGKSEVAIENARLYQQTDAALAQRVEELSSIAEVDRELSASLDLQHVIELVLARAIERTGATAGLVGLVAGSASHLNILAWRGYPADTLLDGRQGPWSTRMGIIGRVVRTGQPALVADVHHDPDYFEGLPGAQSQLTVPIVRESQVIGVLNLESTQTGAFEQDALQFVEHLADHAAIAITNARLFQEEHRRAQEMAAFNEINRTISASLDLKTTLDTIIQNVERIVPFFVAEICLWDAAQKLMVTHGCAGEPDYTSQMGGFYRLDEGYTGWIAHYRQPLLIADTLSRQDVRPKFDLPDRPIRAYLGVPLIVNENLVGTLELASTQPGAYSSQDLATLQTFASQAAVAIENARLFEATQRLLDELSLLYQAGQATTSSLDVQQVLNSVANVMSQAIGVDSCSISEWEEGTDTLLTLTDVGHPLAQDVGKTYSLAEYPATARLLTTRQPLIVRTDDPTADASETHLLQEFGYATMLALPLIVRDRVIGLVELYTVSPRDYSENDIELAQALTNQAAVALENARLYEAQRRRAEELSGLYDIALRSSSTLALDELLRQTMPQVVQLLNAEKGTLLLYDPNQRMLIAQPAASFGAAPKEIARFCIPIDAQNFHSSVFATGRSFISHDLAHDKRIIPAYRPFVQVFDARNALGVPLPGSDGNIGELYVINKQSGSFTPDDDRLLGTIASHLALAIEKARLYTQTDESLRIRVEELTALNQISREMNATLDLQQILQVLLEQALRTTEASHGNVMLLDAESQKLQLLAAQGCQEHEIRAMEEMVLQDALYQQNSIRQVLDERRPHVTLDTRRQPSAICGCTDTRSIISVPILYREQVAGLINLGSTAVGHFTDEHVRFTQALALQAAIAIGNARAYEEQTRQGNLLRRRTEQMDSLLSIARALRADLPLHEVLEEIAYGISYAVGFQMVLVSVVEQPADDDRPYLRRIAMAGVPLAVFEEMKQTRQPLEPVARIMRSEYRISQSYFLPWENKGDWATELDSHIIMPPEQIDQWQNDTWHPEDALLVPLRSTDGQLLGIITVDQPLNGKRPTLFVAESLELFAYQAAITLENARLFTLEQERRRLADTLRQVAEAISATLNLEKVLQIVLDHLRQVVDYDSATIQLLSDNHLEIIAARGHPRPEEVIGLTFPLDQGHPNREAILSQEPYIVPDVTEQYRAFFQQASQPPIRSWMGVPLFFHDQPVGLITLDKYTPGFYNQQAAQIASLFATQAAVALQNARLFEETKRHVAEMDVLLEAGQNVSATLEMETTLHTILSYATRLVRASCGWILLVSLEDKIITRRATHGLDEHLLKDLGYDFFQGGLEGWVMRERTPALSRALTEDERLTDRVRLWLAEQHLGSATVVPLQVKDQVVGVLAVLKDRTDRPLSQHELDLLSVMASQAAIALENAELFAERERNIAELSIMYQTGRAISGSLDLEAIVNMIYTQISQVMDATNFFIAFYNPDTEEVSFPLAVESGERRNWPARQKGQGLTEYILKHKRPLLLPDRVRARLLNLGVEPIGKEAHSWLGVPMLAGDQVLGVMCVQSYERENSYDQDHLSLLSTIAAQAAVAVRNAQLYRQVQDLVQEMEKRVAARTEELVQAVSDLMMERDRVQTLYRITSDLASSLDVDRVLNRALSLVCEAVGAPQGSILLLDSESEFLVHRSALRRQEPLPRNGVKTRYREGVGLAGWVLETQEAVIVPDVTQDERWLKDDEEHQSKSALAVPLLLGDAAPGVLLLFHPRPDYFTEDHLQLVMTIGYQLASAINNADLYTLVQESAERLGKLARANQAEAAQSQAILEAIADGVMVTDAQGQVILFNAAAGRILGAPRQAVVGRSIQDMSGLYGTAGSSWAALSAAWQMGQADDRTFLAERLELEDRVVSVHLAPVFIEHEFLGTVSVFRDITHDVEVARMKSEFVSTVSHELRTPMTSIKGFVDLLLLGAAGNISEQQRHFLGIIKSNVDRLATLVGDLLDLSRIETGRLRLRRERLAFSEVVQAVLDSLHARIEEKGLELIADVPERLPTVMGDRDRLIQILTNLVANAYQYTPSGGQIRIIVTPQDGFLQVSVTDTGIGISEEDQNKIFDRFFRADHPVVRASGGTGLGLPIVKSLVELHGGQLWLHSTLGEGSAFTFTLPFRPVPESAPESGGGESVKGQSAPPTQEMGRADQETVTTT